MCIRDSFKDLMLKTADALVMTGGTGHNAPGMKDHRVVLFASVCPAPIDGVPRAPRYNPDLQFTGLTLFVSLFPDVWDFLTVPARQEVVRVMNWYLHMCLPQRLSLTSHFVNFPIFAKCIEDMERAAWAQYGSKTCKQVDKKCPENCFDFFTKVGNGDLLPIPTPLFLRAVVALSLIHI